MISLFGFITLCNVLNQISISFLFQLEHNKVNKLEDVGDVISEQVLARFDQRLINILAKSLSVKQIMQ